MLGVVAFIAVLVVAGLGVSRSQTADALASAEADLDDMRSRLTAANDRADTLGSQVGRLEAERDDLRAEVDAASVEAEDVRRSLASCHDFFRFSSELVRHGGIAPAGTQARMASELVSCFEGKVPPSLF